MVMNKQIVLKVVLFSGLYLQQASSMVESIPSSLGATTIRINEGTAHTFEVSIYGDMTWGDLARSIFRANGVVYAGEDFFFQCDGVYFIAPEDMDIKLSKRPTSFSMLKSNNTCKRFIFFQDHQGDFILKLLN